MKAQTAFVWPDRAVILHAIADIYMHLPFIVHPWDTELNLPLRLYKPLKKRILTELLFICLNDNSQRLKHLFHRLMEFRLRRVLCHYLLQDFINI